jgi:hypothetical protein
MGRWVLENDGVCGGFWVEEEEMWADRMVDMGSANGGYGAFLWFIRAKYWLPMLLDQ